MKIAIVTLFTEEIADYGAIGAANKQAYGLHHGYDCFVYREWLDTRRHPAWSKLVAIKRHLPDYDWVFWTDADSLVMNGEQTLEAIIAKRENKDMILTWEAGASPVNTGQWLIRNTEWSSAALSAIEDPACSNSRPKWFEQGALIEWLKADERRWSHLALLHPRVHELHTAGRAVRQPIGAPITLPARRFHYSFLAACAKARGGPRHDDQIRCLVETPAATVYVAFAQSAEIRVARANLCNVA